MKETDEHPYITRYGETNQLLTLPTMTMRKTSYGNPQETNEHPYVTIYEKSKEMYENSYITRYRNKTNQRTYIIEYRNFKETKEPPSQDAMSECKNHLYAHMLSHN